MSTDLQLGKKYGRRAVALYLVSTALIVAVGLLGPSVVVLTLTGRHPWLPSYWFDAHANDWLVSVMIYVAIALGGDGGFLSTQAPPHGWGPPGAPFISL